VALLGVDGVVGRFDNHLVVLAGGNVGYLVVSAKGCPVVIVVGNDFEGAMIVATRAIAAGRAVCLRHSSAVVCRRSRRR